MRLRQKKFLPEYSCGDTPAPLWKLTFVLPEVMTECWRGKSISGRTGAIFGQAGAKKKRRKMKYLLGDTSKCRSLLLNNMMSEERFV